jgi:RIO kinase 2
MQAVTDDPSEESDDGEDDYGEEDREETRFEQDEDLPEEGVKQGHDENPTDSSLDKAEGSSRLPTRNENTENVDAFDRDGLSPSRLARELSRSPPQSRSPSPSSLAKMTAALSISSSQHPGIKDIVSSDLTKQRARQRQKYHSKRGAQRVGRPKGSKAKQDNRIKVDRSGVWE